MMPATGPDKPTKVIMLPSVRGGIGHISRTAALARALRRLDPLVEVEFVLDTEWLRPFNIDATLKMGFRPRLLPSRKPENRDAIIRACLGDADVIVDDVVRYLVPFRHALPGVAWVSILMHPVHDELYMDWPYMAQMDALIWPYAPLVGLPDLGPVADKVVQTGPFLETEGVPDKAAARARLGFNGGDPIVVYAPRGFPFGPEFGHHMLASLFAAAVTLREIWPGLTLVLLAVSDLAALRGIPGVPDELPGWVRVESVVTPPEALLFERAADILIGEGTSTMHEGAALRTSLVLVPGPIQETQLLARKLSECSAADVFSIEAVTPDVFAATFRSILAGGGERAAMLDRAHALVTGGGGADAAARLVLDIAARRTAANRMASGSA